MFPEEPPPRQRKLAEAMARQRSAVNSETGSFSDLLSKAGSSPQNKTTVSSDGGDLANASGGEDAQAAGTVPLNMREGARMRPMIALRDASFKQQAIVQSEAAAAAKTGKGLARDGGDTAADMLDIEGDETSDGSGKIPEKNDADAEKGAKPIKPPQSRIEGDKNADPDFKPPGGFRSDFRLGCTWSSEQRCTRCPGRRGHDPRAYECKE